MINLNSLTGNGVGGNRDTEKKHGEIGQEDFLKMMVTQLKNQDPFSPMENGEFLAQIAQFSTATGIQDMQKSFNSFKETITTQQALQAASLVGREVLVESDRGYLPADGELEATIFTPVAVQNLKVGIYTESGVLVREVEMGVQPAGDIPFQWDGKDSGGRAVEPGRYVLKPVSVIDGQPVALGSLVSASVQSVALGYAGAPPTLTLEGLGSISLEFVQEIR